MGVLHIVRDNRTEACKGSGHRLAAVCAMPRSVGAQTAWSHGEDDRLCVAQRSYLSSSRHEKCQTQEGERCFTQDFLKSVLKHRQNIHIQTSQSMKAG